MAIEWGSVAQWVSGLGSLSAVVTALYLAADARRIKLTGYCGLRILIGAGEPRRELLFVSVTNVGHRTAVVNNIGMKTGRLRKRYAIVTALRDAYSDGVPVSLEDGKVAKWGIPMDDERKWIRELAADFVLSKSDVRTLRFIIYTTHGYSKVLKPEKPLVQAIEEALLAKSG